MADPTPRERVAEHFLADVHERVRFQHDYALQGFKALILLNGGAIIALLTYAGHEAAGKAAATGFGHAFIAYAVGLVTATLAYLASYLSQSEFADNSMLEAYRQLQLEVKPKKPQGALVKTGMVAVSFGIGLSVASLAAFVTGSALAMSALS